MYKCTKCKCIEYENGEIRVSWGLWTKIFNIQNKKFITVSCKECWYTDIYKTWKTRTAENIFDFLMN
jgi:predicted nucleic-acid-binding Zn-ribbon protein